LETVCIQLLTRPSVEARADILRIHSRKMNLTRGIDLTKIAEKMNGCSGAELKGVCTEAGMYALRERRVHVTQEDFGKAYPLSSYFPVTNKIRSGHGQDIKQAGQQGDESVKVVEVNHFARIDIIIGHRIIHLVFQHKTLDTGYEDVKQNGNRISLISL
jgi:SpoVK/Ycf46/Vps4 family AAA+-type ATPase